MFVWTTFLEKKTRRETLYVTLSKFGYCQFFNLNKNNNPVKTNDTRNRYSTSQGHEKKKRYPESFSKIRNNDISKQQSHGRAPLELQIYLFSF